MSKLMSRLEKLKSFETRGENIRKRHIGIQAEIDALDKEFSEWMQSELGIQGQSHLSAILLKTLEQTIDAPKIITP